MLPSAPCLCVFRPIDDADRQCVLTAVCPCPVSFPCWFMCFSPIDVVPSPIVDMSSLPIDFFFFPLCVPNYVSLPYQQYVPFCPICVHDRCVPWPNCAWWLAMRFVWFRKLLSGCVSFFVLVLGFAAASPYLVLLGMCLYPSLLPMTMSSEVSWFKIKRFTHYLCFNRMNRKRKWIFLN